jgi:Domain of unknown function (DUF4253)
MVTGMLPEDGEVQIGAVALPAGRRQYSEEDDQPVAWATVEPMADAGRAWCALSAAHAETGLVPVLLQAAAPVRPGADELLFFGFILPADIALLDQMSAGSLLAALWGGSSDDPRSAAARAPFGPRFPGLAPPGSTRLAAAGLEQAVSALPPARLGLVSARRPADVPPTVGWSVFGVDGIGPGARSLEIGAVLRSWETRFGARLLQIGADAILRVLVERPPSTLEHAQRVAAEHCAFADELDERADYTVASLAASLVGAPIWTFWWD